MLLNFQAGRGQRNINDPSLHFMVNSFPFFLVSGLPEDSIIMRFRSEKIFVKGMKEAESKTFIM
jgi:hypothetical protein